MASDKNLMTTDYVLIETLALIESRLGGEVVIRYQVNGFTDHCFSLLAPLVSSTAARLYHFPTPCPYRTKIPWTYSGVSAKMEHRSHSRTGMDLARLSDSWAREEEPYGHRQNSRVRRRAPTTRPSVVGLLVPGGLPLSQSSFPSVARRPGMVP
jgi:hypothetical protein